MKLTYRGVTYDYKPPRVVYGPSYATGKYRGTPVSFRALQEIPVFQPSYNLKYRGVTYFTGASIKAKETEHTSITTSPEKVSRMPLKERARALMAGHHQLIRRREQAMLTRLDQEVGFTAEDAARYESHIQGKVRHNFRKVYDRSQAAMS